MPSNNKRKSAFSRMLARLGRTRTGFPVRRVLTKKEKLEKVKREIRVCQVSQANVITKTPFERYVKELVRENKTDGMSTQGAKEALMEAAQIFVTELFEDAELAREHAKRETVMPQDIQLVRTLWAKFQERHRFV